MGKKLSKCARVNKRKRETQHEKNRDKVTNLANSNYNGSQVHQFSVTEYLKLQKQIISVVFSINKN